MLRRARILLWVMVGLAALGALLLVLRAEPPGRPEPQSVALGGTFSLTDSSGRRVASTSFHGTPYALFFGFTHCPDVCPTTLARLAKLRRQLGKGDDAFRIILVSVDPERDTPAELARYAALFDTPIVALTGSEGDIGRVKQLFGAYSAKAPQPGGGYSVDHTSTVFLVDKDGRFQSTIATEEGDPAALAKLQRLTA